MTSLQRSTYGKWHDHGTASVVVEISEKRWDRGTSKDTTNDSL
jgi:hypothetical protein